MRKLLSAAVCWALVMASVGPAVAADVVRAQGQAPVVLPVVGVNTSLNAADPGVNALAALPTVNSIDAQAVDAAAFLAPAPAALTPSAGLSAPSAGLDAAVQATAAEASAELAAPTARAQLDGVQNALPRDASSSASDDKASEDRVWTGLRAQAQDSPLPEAPSRAPETRSRRWLAKTAVGAAVALDSSIALASPAGSAPAAPAALPHWLCALVTKYTPYLSVAAGLAVVYAVNKGVQALIDKAAKRAGWQKSTTVVVKRAASLGVYGLGTVVGMHVGGAPAAVTTAVAGLGTTAVTMASKTILGNALEASKVLLYHSFVVGDRLKIGDDTYTVSDLSLRYVTLKNDAYKGRSPTNFTYLQLAATPLTVLRPYEANHKLDLRKSGVTVGGVVGAAGKAVAQAKRKTWLWLAGSLAVAVGATYLAPAVGVSAVAVALGYLKAAAVFSVAHNARSLVIDFIQNLSEKAGWNTQTTLVAKLVAEVAAYTIGGSWALRAVGTSWMMLLGGLGTTGLAFTLVTQDILSNLVTAGWLMSDRNKDKSINIGEYVAVGKLLGKVVDMNFQYVVLDHEDGTHTLISYAFIKDTPFTIISPEDLPAARQKYSPPAAPDPNTK